MHFANTLVYVTHNVQFLLYSYSFFLLINAYITVLHIYVLLPQLHLIYICDMYYFPPNILSHMIKKDWWRKNSAV